MFSAIEQALESCNGDIFAVICRQYLSFKYSLVYPTGLVVGKDKSKKGTPDTFIPIKDYYLFVEITTQENKILDKLRGDITHCFSQKDVPKEKIAKVILMFNGEYNTQMHEELKAHLNSFSNDCVLQVIDKRILTNEIYKSYPSLVRKLGIPIDTAQILERPEFIEDYEKSKFATPLSNEFFNRGEELAKALNLLKEFDILLLTGNAGVGKTKMSLELTELFLKEQDNYVLKYVRANSRLDIWEDLQTHLLQDEQYLLVLDDANKLKSNLEQILNFQRKRSKPGRIKIILTVRNYVQKEVEKLLDNFALISLKNFTKDELKSILQSDDFNISDYYVDRIFNISKGNPRLAIMAATAGLNNELDKLHNPSQIMDKYFSSVSQTINSFENKNLRKVAGILAIFKTIDFDYDTQIDEIEKYFGISAETLQQCLKNLFQIEIADEFENAYKIADQILGEYLIFLVFIKEKEIPFSKLIEIYVDKKGRFGLGRMILQQVTNFSLESIGNYIEQEIKECWIKIEDDLLAFTFIKDFYYYIPNETLVFFTKKGIVWSGEKLEDYTFEVFDNRSINSYGDDIIDVLLRFQYLGKELYRLSLIVLLEYGITSQNRFHKLLKALKEGFSLNKNSHLFDYNQQIDLFDVLYGKLVENKLFYSKVILFIAPNFLIDCFRSTYNEGSNIVMGTYNVMLSDAQKEFRIKLWKFIFDCYRVEDLKRHAQVCLQAYSNNLDYHNKSQQVISFDQEVLMVFFEKDFDYNDFIDNAIIDTYINKVKWIEIEVDDTLLKKLDNRAFKFYSIMTDKRNEEKEYNLRGNEYDKYKTRQISRYLKGFQKADFKSAIDDLGIIFKNKEFLDNNSYRLSRSISRMLKIISNKDFNLFLSLYKKIVRSDFTNEVPMNYFNQLRLNAEKVVQFRKLLSKNTYIFYLPHFQVSISKRHIVKEDFELFMGYLRNKKITFFWFLQELVIKFSTLNPHTHDTLTRILKILAFRAKKERIVVPNTFFLYIHQEHPELFDEKIEVIQDLYLKLDKYERHFDYSLEVLKILLEKKPKYIIKVLDSHFGDLTYMSGNSLLENDFRKLWDLENYLEVFSNILNYSNKFHRISDNPDTIVRIFENKDQKQLNFLRTYLETADDNGMLMVFNIVVSIFKEHRMGFIDLLLKKGIGLETFRHLDFVVSSITYSGSIIPRYKQRISELEKYEKHLQEFGDIKLLPYIEEIRKKMDGYNRFIESERKREFLSDWGFDI